LAGEIDLQESRNSGITRTDPLAGFVRDAFHNFDRGTDDGFRAINRCVGGGRHDTANN
jgi:hypothetical protein